MGKQSPRQGAVLTRGRAGKNHGQGKACKAIDFLEKAGQEALNNGDYEKAERYFKACLELDATAAVLSSKFFEKKLAQESAIN